MSKLTKEDVLKVADLIKIHLTEEEVSRIQKQLETALQPVSVFDELDLKDVSTTSQTVGTKNRIRKDVPKAGLSQKLALLNAHNSQNGYFIVSRVVRNEH